MADISIVPLNEIKQADRWDGEYFRPSYRKLGKQLHYLCNLKISDISELSDNKFNPDTVEQFNYIEISNIDTICGEVAYEKVNSLSTPDRAQFLMKGGEILISTVRPNRSAIGLLPFSAKGYVASSGFAPLLAKDRQWRSFLFIWLKIKAITDWLERHTTASMYPAVSVRDILNTPCYSPSDELINKIHDIVDSAISILSRSRQLYPEAEAELLARMEWDKLAKKPNELFYIEKFAETQKKDRFDAEYFQPQYKRLQHHLRQGGAKMLSEIYPFISRGVQPEYDENGDILLINSQHLSAQFIDISSVERTTQSFYELPSTARARLNKYDVLVYATGAYVGRSNVYLNASNAVAGIDILIVRPNKAFCDPVYLALFLNSIPGVLQSEQIASGSAQRHVYPKDLKQFIIYLPLDKKGAIDLVWQKKLADKIIRANEAKVEAQAMLEKAKKIVEDLINASM